MGTEETGKSTRFKPMLKLMEVIEHFQSKK